ncbi:MAG: hypothetical protein AAGU27_04615 [Dehalobacterium sp.]
MLDDILKDVERINKRINEISRFNYLGLSGVIILSKDWDSSGVLLLSDEREIQFSISSTGQLKAMHESNQRLVSGLRLKIMDINNLIDQRDKMFQEFVTQVDNQSLNNDRILACEIDNT